MDSPVFFHVDLDAFFASVEQRDNPQYRGKPVIVGGTGPRSVVSTCSYEARKYGVHSAMPSSQARRLCPDGVFVNVDMKRYSEVSRQVMAILHEYAPHVNQVSIDEAWLDMSGTRLLFGPAKPLAQKIKERIKNEVGITMSIGIAASPFIAKMASDYNKPDGLCVVSPGREQMFIDAIGLEKIWGIGKSSFAALKEKGFTSPSDVRAVPEESLCRMFGQSMGHYIHTACHGIDPGVYSSQSKSHSISTETTFAEDVKDRQTLAQVLLSMSQELMGRSLDENLMARTIGLKLRWGDFRTITVQTTPEFGVLNSERIFECACRLLDSKWTAGQGIRLIGLGLYQMYKGDVPMQDSLFSDEDHRRRRLDKVVHQLEARGLSVKKASEL